MSTIRERHAHVFVSRSKKQPESCDAAKLLAAGDALRNALIGLHLLRAPGDEELECVGCDAQIALAEWKAATGG